jgi:hypothetical protein
VDNPVLNVSILYFRGKSSPENWRAFMHLINHSYADDLIDFFASDLPDQKCKKTYIRVKIPVSMLFNTGNPYSNGLPAILNLTRSDFHYSISDKNLNAVNRQAVWNVLVYMAAGDPDLAGPMFEDLMEMKAVGSSDRMHLCAFFDGPLLTDSFYARLNRETAIGEDIIFRFLDVNSSNQNTLLEIIRNTTAIYPSEKRLLVLSGHGKGWQGLLPDFQVWRQYRDSGRLALPDGKIGPSYEHLLACYRETHGTIYSRFGSDDELKTTPPFDIVAFDACQMANIEALAIFSGNAPLIIASEAPIPASGYPYNEILNVLLKQPEISPRELAEEMVASIAYFYATDPEAPFPAQTTLAVFNGTLLQGLFERLGTFSQALVDHLNRDSARKIMDCLDNTFTLEGGYRDLIGFAMNVRDRRIAAELTDYSESLVDYYLNSGLVIRCEVPGGRDNANGLSIYLPAPEDFDLSYRAHLNHLPEEFKIWALFIRKYFSWLLGEDTNKNPLLPFLA